MKTTKNNKKKVSKLTLSPFLKEQLQSSFLFWQPKVRWFVFVILVRLLINDDNMKLARSFIDMFQI